jgi:quinol monooxygenase YgiN
MDSQKIYLLAELTVLPEFLDDVKGALKQAHIPTLHEAGCEGMFETSREGDPHKLLFFKIFSSSAAHKFHLDQDYTKRLSKALEGKLAGPRSYMNAERNIAFAREAKGDGRISLQVLFLHAAYDYICATVDTQLTEPMRESCSDLTKRRSPQVTGRGKRSRWRSTSPSRAGSRSSSLSSGRNSAISRASRARQRRTSGRCGRRPPAEQSLQGRSLFFSLAPKVDPRLPWRKLHSPMTEKRRESYEESENRDCCWHSYALCQSREGVCVGVGPAALAKHAVRGLLDRHDVDPDRIDAIVFGAVVPERGKPNLAREIVLEAGLSPRTEGQTISSYCITGLRTATTITDAIAAGRISAGIAGGVEWLSGSDPSTFNEPSTGLSMGQHTEITRKEWGISRVRQDEIALASHRNAVAARKRLVQEIVPFESVSSDSGPRPDTSLERLATLTPAFDADGTITAGTSSPVTDGA